ERYRERSEFDHAAHSRGKPTPTQEENDLAMWGAHIVEHEDDGSGPDHRTQTRQVEADKTSSKPQTYQTKGAAPAKAE
ncbi:MAG: hypothetical protein ABWY82_14395, partial [Tardiphaga sp.]